MRKSTAVTLAASALAAAALAGCTTQDQPSGTAAEAAQATAGTNLIIANQPVPVFATSAYRQELIEIEAIQALGSPTTTFDFPPGVTPNMGIAPIKTCPSEGLPVPNTAQLSNPDQVVPDPNASAGSVTVPQMDPNGVYTPTSSSGTYVLCLTASGGTRITYWEGDVYAESGAAVWSPKTGITDVGPSQLPVCTIETARAGDGTGVKAGTRYYHCVKA